MDSESYSIMCIFARNISSLTLPHVMDHDNMCLSLIQHHMFALVLKTKAVFSMWGTLSIRMPN